MGDGSAPRSDSKGKSRTRQNGDVLAMDIVSAEEGYGGRSGPYAQMQLVEQQVSCQMAGPRVSTQLT